MDLKLNFNTANINKLFDLIKEFGFDENAFTEDTEIWGGEDKITEEEKISLRIFWNENQKYKFVWQLSRLKNQIYFEPNGVLPYGFENRFPMLTINNYRRILNDVHRLFKEWLEKLKEQIEEDKKASKRKNKITQVINNDKSANNPNEIKQVNDFKLPKRTFGDED